MIRTILFDSDGVLVDTERLFFEATRDTFAIDGVILSPYQWGIWFLTEGRRSREIGELLGLSSLRMDEIIKDRDRLFWAKIDSGVCVLPGVRETLSQLSKDYRLAVVTGASREHFQRVHQSTSLTGFFEHVTTRDDYHQAKPDPECYLRTLEALSVDAGECLAVEDSPRGARAAVAAGLRCVVVPTPLTNLDLCPEGCEIINDIMDLPILNKNGR